MRMKIRYLIARPGSAGLPRYFWSPSAELRALGHRMQRVPLNWQAFGEPEALLAAAIARAEELNAALDAGRDALPDAAPPALRTLGAMLDAYRRSKKFAKLAASTQRGYKQCIRKLEDWGGRLPLIAIGPKQVQNMIEGLSATPAFANACARTLQAAMEFARLEGWITVNPATRMGLLASAPSGLIWPAHVVAGFVATADAMGLPGMGDAVLLNEWLGQRQGDILRMPRTVYRNGNLVLRQNKGGVAVSLPIDMVPHLAARLEAALLRSDGLTPKPTTIIVSDETRLPYKPDNFRHVFARVRTRLAETMPSFEVDYLPPGRDMAAADAFIIRTEDLTFMHLRHTAVVRLAESNVDMPGISAISGHTLASIPSILKRYMVRTQKLARGAFQRRMDAEGIKAAEAVTKDRRA